MFDMSDSQRHLFMFNLNTLIWTPIEIWAHVSGEMFIDSNDVMTLKVYRFDKNKAFYRFNLRFDFF